MKNIIANLEQILEDLQGSAISCATKMTENGYEEKVASELHNIMHVIDMVENTICAIKHIQ